MTAPIGLRLVGGLAALLAIGVGPTRAHDAWSDGSPVPAWVKAECCGIDDVHHLDAGQVHRTPEGYLVDGYPRAIPAGLLLPSRDGEWWVFYKRFGEGAYSDVFCFFGPMSF